MSEQFNNRTAWIAGLATVSAMAAGATTAWWLTEGRHQQGETTVVPESALPPVARVPSNVPAPAARVPGATRSHDEIVRDLSQISRQTVETQEHAMRGPVPVVVSPRPIALTKPTPAPKVAPKAVIPRPAVRHTATPRPIVPHEAPVAPKPAPTPENPEDTLNLCLSLQSQASQRAKDVLGDTANCFPTSAPEVQGDDIKAKIDSCRADLQKRVRILEKLYLLDQQQRLKAAGNNGRGESLRDLQRRLKGIRPGR